MGDSALGRLEALKSWDKSGDVLQITTAVDVGGSGLRVQLGNALNPSQFCFLGHFPASSTEGMIKHCLDLIVGVQNACGNFISKGASLGIAGPIRDGEAVMTNWAGPLEERTLRLTDLPEQLFPRGRTVLVNDLEAAAYGLVSAGSGGDLGKYFTQLFSARAQPVPPTLGRRAAILAMGSGLGIGLIVGGNQALSSELGHLQVGTVLPSHKDFEEETALLQAASKHFERGPLSPEYEDLSSARGMRFLYSYFSKKPVEEVKVREVAVAAKNGTDEAGIKAMATAHKYLVRAAKAVATSMNCDRVFLALDNQARDYWLVKSKEEMLMDEFYEFIRPDWIQGISIYTQHELCNFNILGTAWLAQREAEK